MIELKDINLSFPMSEGLHDINVTIHPGDIIALIGPSGSGKSTLLRVINLLQRPDTGHVIIDGQDLMNPKTDLYNVRKRIGMVFQAFTLFQHKMLIENVMMGPMDLLHVSKQQAYDDAKKYLRMVGLGEKLYSFPSELSGGQIQRGEIARCIAMNPEILLLDEPTSALDATMAGEVQAVVNRLAQQGMTMILVTHDMQFCRNIANRIFVMVDGRIVEDGPPSQIFEHPQSEETYVFIQRMRTFTYEIHSKNFDLYALTAGLENFGRDYFIHPRLVHNMELLTEELIIHSLLPKTEEIHISMNYYEVASQVTMTFDYGGRAFNPFDDEDEDILSMLLVRQLSQDVDYSHDSMNHLKLTIA